MNFLVLLPYLLLCPIQTSSYFDYHVQNRAKVLSISPMEDIVPDKAFEISISFKTNKYDSLIKGDTLQIYVYRGFNRTMVLRKIVQNEIKPDSSVVLKIHGYFDSEFSFYTVTEKPKPSRVSSAVYIDGEIVANKNLYFTLLSKSEVYTFTPIVYSQSCVGNFKMHDSVINSNINKIEKNKKYNVSLDLNNYISDNFDVKPEMDYVEVDYYSISGEITVKVKGPSGIQPWCLTDTYGRELARGSLDISFAQGINIENGKLPAGRYTLTIGEGSSKVSGNFTVR